MVEIVRKFGTFNAVQYRRPHIALTLQMLCEMGIFH